MQVHLSRIPRMAVVSWTFFSFRCGFLDRDMQAGRGGIRGVVGDLTFKFLLWQELVVVIKRKVG